jgi:hypothetical protein
MGDLALAEQPAEGLVDAVMFEPASARINEEWRLSGCVGFDSARDVSLQCLTGGSGKRNPSVFFKLSFADIEGALLRVEIFQVEMERFAAAQAGGVE